MLEQINCITLPYLDNVGFKFQTETIGKMFENFTSWERKNLRVHYKTIQIKFFINIYNNDPGNHLNICRKTIFAREII